MVRDSLIVVVDPSVPIADMNSSAEAGTVSVKNVSGAVACAADVDKVYIMLRNSNSPSCPRLVP